MGVKAKTKAAPFSKRAKVAPVLSPDVAFDGSGEGGASPLGWHSVEAFLRCPKEYQLKVIRGISKPVHQEPEHFSVGRGFHAGRARWFRLNFADSTQAWKSIEEAVREEEDKQKLPSSATALSSTLALLHLYAEHWLKQPRPTPVAAEYMLGPTPIYGDARSSRTARIDDASRYPMLGNKLYIGEAKTTSGGLAATITQYELHGQPLLQYLLWKLAPQGEAMHGPCAGIMLDVVKKPQSGKKPEFARVAIPVPDYVLTWFAKSMWFYLQAVSKVDWDAEVPRNVGQCSRPTSHGGRFPCDYQALCKYGRAATINYVLPGGKSLASHKPEPGKEKNPWD